MEMLEFQEKTLERYSVEIQQAKSLFSEVVGQLATVRSGELDRAQSTVLRGSAEISRALEEAVSLARTEVIGMHPGVPISQERLAEGRLRNQRLLDRGINMRSVHLSAMLRTSFGPAHLRNLENGGAKVRIAPVLPLRCVVVDRRVAVVSTPAMEQEGSAFRMECAAALEILIHFFDHLWVHGAVPLSVAMEGVTEVAEHEDARGGEEAVAAEEDAETEALTSREQALLRLMANGLKDEAIARDLGVSPRTLRRLIADLMRRLDCESRFQAGVEAVSRGWLDVRARNS